MRFPQMRLAVATMCLATPTFAHARFFEGFDSGLPSAADAAPPGVGVTLASGEWHILNLSDPVGLTSVLQGNPFVSQSYEGADDGYAVMNYFSGAAASTDLSVSFMSPVQTFENGDTIAFFSRTTDVPPPGRIACSCCSAARGHAPTPATSRRCS